MGLPRKKIDSLEFARTRSSLRGELAVAGLTRLADMLAAQRGSLRVSLEGSRGQDGGFWLDLAVSGELQLVCQRCLGGVAFPVAIDRRLQLIRPGQPWPDEDVEDDGVEPIEADAELDVSVLVEDEVLLALPIVPKHENCRSPGSKSGDRKDVAAEPSPFAALATLKKHQV